MSTSGLLIAHRIPSLLSPRTEQTRRRNKNRTWGAVKVTARNWILFESNEVSDELRVILISSAYSKLDRWCLASKEILILIVRYYWKCSVMFVCVSTWLPYLQVGVDGRVVLPAGDSRAVHMRHVLKVDVGQQLRVGIIGGDRGTAIVSGLYSFPQ